MNYADGIEEGRRQMREEAAKVCETKSTLANSAVFADLIRAIPVNSDIATKHDTADGIILYEGQIDQFVNEYSSKKL